MFWRAFYLALYWILKNYQEEEKVFTFMWYRLKNEECNCFHQGTEEKDNSCDHVLYILYMGNTVEPTKLMECININNDCINRLKKNIYDWGSLGKWQVFRHVHNNDVWVFGSLNTIDYRQWHWVTHLMLNKNDHENNFSNGSY